MKRFTLFFICLAISAKAAPLTPEQKTEEIQSLSNLMRAQYGPLEFKRSAQKIDIEQLTKEFVQSAKNTTNTEFYYLMNRYVAAFRDSHFRAQVKTSYTSQLGFTTDLAGGKILIDTVDTKELSETMFPFKRGDELVSLNGQPVEDVLKSLTPYLGMGNPESSRRLAAMMIVARPAALFPTQDGKAIVAIRRSGQPHVWTVELNWKHTGEEPIEKDSWTSIAKRPDYMDLSIRDVTDLIPNAEKSYRCSGESRIKAPAGAEYLIQKPFVAYIHDSPKGKIGYLRIPHYSWTNTATKQSENELRYRQYEWAIFQMEQKTNGLIIDQDHNCGGSVELVENTVGLFMDRPFNGLEFQFLATRHEFQTFKSWMSEDIKSTIEGLELTEILNLIKTHWSKGDRMTAKTSFHGSRKVNPNPIRYTKPVVILIDEMSGSGGDAFPAMMQGNDRAVLFGKRTMGAGGHVIEMPDLMYSGNSLRMTKSLFFHPNGTPIENNGATPDLPYSITEKDFTEGYRGYHESAIQKLMERMP